MCTVNRGAYGDLHAVDGHVLEVSHITWCSYGCVSLNTQDASGCMYTQVLLQADNLH